MASGLHRRALPRVASGHVVRQQLAQVKGKLPAGHSDKTRDVKKRNLCSNFCSAESGWIVGRMRTMTFGPAQTMRLDGLREKAWKDL